MCKYCTPNGGDGFVCSTLANHGTFSGDGEGMMLQLICESKYKIENGTVVQDKDQKDLISYLKASRWNKQRKEAEHLAMEIFYCPICGRELP